MTAHRVLVVEDDLEIREAVLSILEDHGCEAIGASNGLEALSYLRSVDRLPCLILLDLMMPVMDGHGFRQEQLRDPVLASIPVIVVSAYRDVEANARQLNATSFIKKPPRIEELMSAIQRHC